MIEQLPISRPLQRISHSQVLVFLYGALVLLPIVVTPFTWLAFLRLPPAGSGLTGCLLDQYCHFGPVDIIHSQILGLVYVVLPFLTLPYFWFVHRADLRLALIAQVLGTLRFGLPLAIWLVGAHLERAVGITALFSNCVPDQTCAFQPGMSYYFLTPLEGLSGLASLGLYVLTLTIWLHIRMPVRPTTTFPMAFTRTAGGTHP